MAKLLRPIRIALLILTFLALLLTAYSLVVQSAFSLRVLEPAIVVSLWGMLLLASTELFQQLPSPFLDGESFLQAWFKRLKRFLFACLALIFVFVCTLLSWLSIRLLLI